MKKLFYILSLGLLCITFTESSILPVRAQVASSTFRDLNIQLSKDIASEYTAGDAILIEGKVLDGNKNILFFLKNTVTEEKIMEVGEVGINGDFHIPISLPKTPGEYVIIITSGLSFSTTIHETLTLVEKKILPNTGASGISLSRPVIVYDKYPYLNFGSNVWGELTLEQGKKIYKKSGEIILLDNIPLQYGNTRVTLRGYSLLDKTPFVWSGSVYIDRTRELGGKNLVSLSTLRSIRKMQFRIKKGQKVKPEYYVTTPSGDILEYTFPKNYIGTDGYLKTDTLIKQSFPIPEAGVYKIETVQYNGLAYFNLPISRIPFWSIKIPITEDQKKTLRNNKNQIARDTIASINTLRTSLGRNILESDTTLTELAQKKAEDMAAYDYIGHTTKTGLGILDFAKSKNIKINSKSIGENVAGGWVSDIALQDLLEESGSHRYNMISPEWKSVGIGYVLRDKKTYIVQIFGN